MEKERDAIEELSDEVKEWLAIRKKEGRKINPETAKVDFIYAQTLDPYGVYPEPPQECWQVGREYFARSPGSDVWLWFGDLPAATAKALWEKHKAKLAFPAGLEPMIELLRNRPQVSSDKDDLVPENHS
jgi:hypothetical protein